MRRIPLHLKLLRGNPGQRRLNPEVEPAAPESMPEPPDFLGEHAVNEWNERGPELVRLGLLRVTDYMVFAVYCQSYHRWRVTEEALAREAARDPATAGLLVKGDGGAPIRNPLVRAADTAAAAMVKYAGEFGLSPVARGRIATGVFSGGNLPSKFDGLLA